jgi:hypothetical protein
MGWVVNIMAWPHFNPGERAANTHWTEGWEGPRTSLDTEARGEILSPLLGIETWSPSSVHNQTLYWLSYTTPDYIIYNAHKSISLVFNINFYIDMNLNGSFWLNFTTWCFKFVYVLGMCKLFQHIFLALNVGGCIWSLYLGLEHCHKTRPDSRELIVISVTLWEMLLEIAKWCPSAESAISIRL